MSKVEIIVPAAGESVTEADIVEWRKSDGDYVEMDEALLELETDKASMDLTAEVAGTLSISIEDGTVKVGDVLGTIDTSATKPAGSSASSEPSAAAVEDTAPAVETQAAPVTTSYATGHPSPSAAKAMAEKGVTADQIQGSGKDGRIIKSDVQSAQASAPAKEAPKVAAPPVVEPRVSGSREERREKMSRMRKTIANRLVNAQHTQALLTTFNEVDMTAIMEIRKKYKEGFKEKHGVGLGFMSFFTKATCEALQEFPIMNASVDGEQIVYRDFCDVGIAVASPKGLVVPVIRNAEAMSFRDIEATIIGYAMKAKAGNITLDDMEGGTFTITNGGTFGSMLSTPIVNFPQSAILGMHNIVQRPMAVDGEVKIRPIM
ncbi:dihydrolipoyllysine-residue succinyltransferase, partial [Candidatus Marinamargulisbacteria bacterium SCGC AG-439-L15]